MEKNIIKSVLITALLIALFKSMLCYIVLAVLCKPLCIYSVNFLKNL